MCEGHCAPIDFVDAWVHERPDVSLVLGPRGGGKSYLAGLATHIDSLRFDRHSTKVLGGSLAQSQQIYGALADFERMRPGMLTRFGRESAAYVTGSTVSILATSEKSVRGPHVPTLRLDEIDEIDPELRQSAVGMCMARDGVRASMSMTSTWHRVGGPMAEMLDQARAGMFRAWTFCVFDVLERCPEERSGAGLERCPECPLVEWCHDGHPAGPRAKRSNGHYTIDALVQKARTVSRRVFEADYLCAGPKADGVWFGTFSPNAHVSERAEYDPALPVVLAIDSGVFTGAVAFQVRDAPDGPSVQVWWDYLSEGLTARANAQAIVAGLGGRRGSRLEVYTDPAGGARNPVGPTVIGEYEAEGLRTTPWPGGLVADGLALVEALVAPASGPPRLAVHPRCQRTIDAFLAYRRARRGGQWQDYPEDPQHPHEDLLDSIRGGLRAKYPDGLHAGRGTTLGRVPLHRVIY